MRSRRQCVGSEHKRPGRRRRRLSRAVVVAVAGSPCGTSRPRPRRTRPHHGAAGPGPGPTTLACRVAASGRVVNWYVSRRAAPPRARGRVVRHVSAAGGGRVARSAVSVTFGTRMPEKLGP